VAAGGSRMRLKVHPPSDVEAARPGVRSPEWGVSTESRRGRAVERVCEAYCLARMLVLLNCLLRRHRRNSACVLAVVAVGFLGLAAHSALMSSDMGSHMGETAAICLVVGGCAVFIGVAVFAARRLLQRPLWLIAVPLTPSLPFVPAVSTFRVRAGPSALLQVFQL
jgi:hypothetical protein